MDRSAAFDDDKTDSAHPARYTTARLEQLLLPVKLPSNDPRAIFRNWGKTYQCRPRAVFIPETEEQCRLIIELARREQTTVRACGAGHSPSDLACTSGYLLRTDKLDRVIEVSPLSLLPKYVPRDA